MTDIDALVVPTTLGPPDSTRTIACVWSRACDGIDSPQWLVRETAVAFS